MPVRLSHSPAIAAEARCPTCQTRCAHARLRFTIQGQPAEISRKLESALNKAGFEVIGRENLERLARENLGVQTAPLNLLYIKYSLLLLQTLLMGGEPKLFLPFLAILRPSGDFTDICLMSVATREKTPQPGLGEQLMHQAWEKLSRATETLSAVS